MAAPMAPYIVKGKLKTPSLLKAVDNSIINRTMTFIPLTKIMNVNALE
jgi:hypothetical protein